MTTIREVRAAARERAAREGVSPRDVDLLLSDALGRTPVWLLARRRRADRRRAGARLRRCVRPTRRARADPVHPRPMRVLQPRLPGRRPRADSAPGDGAARGEGRSLRGARLPRRRRRCGERLHRDHARRRAPRPAGRRGRPLARGARGRVEKREAARCARRVRRLRSPFVVPRRLRRHRVESSLRRRARPRGLQREVVEWEPHSALFAGADGMEVIERLLGEAAQSLRTAESSPWRSAGTRERRCARWPPPEAGSSSSIPISPESRGLRC